MSAASELRSTTGDLVKPVKILSSDLSVRIQGRPLSCAGVTTLPVMSERQGRARSREIVVLAQLVQSGKREGEVWGGQYCSRSAGQTARASWSCERSLA